MVRDFLFRWVSNLFELMVQVTTYFSGENTFYRSIHQLIIKTVRRQKQSVHKNAFLPHNVRLFFIVKGAHYLDFCSRKSTPIETPCFSYNYVHILLLIQLCTHPSSHTTMYASFFSYNTTMYTCHMIKNYNIAIKIEN